ncbi:hypothetical protein MNBD_GAMMA05-223 [hydrothermal vent metagenome]|uniref:Uncharacterized protein n=1 Tax=hydrothermal vent metagenome TaxID=652676 RepID=A0A3B0X0I4_9ZZZZ
MIKIVSVTVIVGQLLFSKIAIASGWTPELDLPRVKQPMETLRISIPEDVSIETLQTLALELDNIDVTAMVTREGGFAVFTPVQPMGWGKHELRLVEYAEDGSIFEKGFWTFEVRTQSGIHESDFSADISLVATGRAADKNLGEPEPDSLTGQGGAALYGKVAGDEWEVTGNMDLIYNSQRELTPNNQELDMGEYLITGQYQSTQLKLGHHSISQTSLAMEGFQRRGVSASKGFSSINSAVTGFVLRTEQINGFEHGLGISDPDNTVYGIVMENQPISSNPELLYLSATYLSGESNTVGASVGASQADQKGETWSIVADSTMLDQQLRFRAEMASSKTDIVTADTADIDLIDAKGDAIAFLATYTPQSISADTTFFWNTGLEFSEVDSLFNSIANPNLPNDKTLQRLFFNADWSGISAQLSAAKETDNVDNDETRPEIETKHNQLLLNYSLTQLPQPGSFFDVTGLPSFSFQWSNTTQEQIKAASINTIFITEGLDIENDTYRLGADFNKTALSWGLAYSESDQKDKVNTTRSSTTTGTDIHASYQVSQYFTIAPSIISNDTEFASDNSNFETDIISVMAQLYLTDKLGGQINLNQSNSTSDSLISPQDTETSTISFQFNWNWIQPKNNHPGFDVSISGTYQDAQNKIITANDLVAYQVFVNLAMSLPVSLR